MLSSVSSIYTNLMCCIKADIKTFCLYWRFINMEFPHELKELYPDKIIEVRGNAEALTVIVSAHVNIDQFSKELKAKHTNLDNPHILFIKHKDRQDFEKVILE